MHKDEAGASFHHAWQRVASATFGWEEWEEPGGGAVCSHVLLLPHTRGPGSCPASVPVPAAAWVQFLLHMCGSSALPALCSCRLKPTYYFSNTSPLSGPSLEI